MAPLAKTKLAYRAEVVGSLLRPDYLKQAFEEFDQDRITEDELTAVQDRAALEAIRLQEASGLERLGLSPQCGFASTLPGNLVTYDDQQAKLELVARVARDIWS